MRSATGRSSTCTSRRTCRTRCAVASRGPVEMKRLLGSGLAIMLIALLGGCSLPGAGARDITVMLGDGAGLYVGNDVGVLGVPVGKVTKVEPTGKVVKVTLK